MNKTKKSSPNSKNYNRKRIRRFEGQEVEVKGFVDRNLNPTAVIIKNACINRRQMSHITLILKEPMEFSKNQRIQCYAIVEPYIRNNNTKSFKLRQLRHLKII